MSSRVYVSSAGQRSSPDIFERYEPPFTLESDMLFVASSVPSQGLRTAFPREPFLSLGGKTPVVMWFSRVRSLAFGPAGARRVLDQASGFSYNELNVLALLKRRGAFVPAIFANHEVSLRLGHRYGMPKRSVRMSFRADEQQIESVAQVEQARSGVRAQLLASGRILALPFDLLAPWWSWRVNFPDGSWIQARIDRIPRAQLARVFGQLDLAEGWLPEPVRLWPLGVLVPGLRMHLPAPEPFG